MNYLQEIKKLLSVLPEKDEKLCRKYFDSRQFLQIFEIVESDIYKAEKERLLTEEEEPDEYITSLSELRNYLITYMTYLDIS